MAFSYLISQFLVFYSIFFKAASIKTLNCYANFPECLWCSQAQFILVNSIREVACVNSIRKVACTCHKTLYTSTPINRFPKVGGVDNFLQISL